MELQSKRIAEEIKILRDDRGLSQQELAHLVGVTRATVSNIERSQQALSLDLFCRIAFALNANPASVLEKILHSNTTIDLSSDVKDEHIRKIIEEAIS